MGSLRPSSSTAATDVASGRNARMITPPGPGCAPSTECGLWCCPATIRSISPRLGPAASGTPASGPAASAPATSGPAASGPGTSGPDALEPDRLGSGCVITGHSISVGELQLGDGL